MVDEMTDDDAEEVSPILYRGFAIVVLFKNSIQIIRQFAEITETDEAFAHFMLQDDNFDLEVPFFFIHWCSFQLNALF